MSAKSTTTRTRDFRTLRSNIFAKTKKDEPFKQKIVKNFVTRSVYVSLLAYLKVFKVYEEKKYSFLVLGIAAAPVEVCRTSFLKFPGY